ncbi:MAG: 4a-hydroxytetrahydrobiopterin dehydratase [Thiobacillus sp.]|nr:4a-hydroxytetrahydrobiopterin dehydratase [Thiobacillus sp.]
MADSFRDLARGQCKPCEGGTPPMSAAAVEANLKNLCGWQVVDGKLRKDFKFPDHYVTMAFVNAVAWISHRQDHHPDLTVGYDNCRVEYSTHAIGGLSENDFICAAKIDVLTDL